MSEFPAEHPAIELPTTLDPTGASAAEQQRLAALQEAVKKQRATTAAGLAETAKFTVNAAPDAAIDAATILFGPTISMKTQEVDISGACDGAAMGFVSREEGNLGRMERGLAHKAEMKKRSREVCVAFFHARKATVEAGAIALVLAGNQRRQA